MATGGSGCDRQFDDPLYLQLDHKTPRSEGSVNLQLQTARSYVG